MNAPHEDLVEEEQRLLAANRQKLLEHPVIVGARDEEIVREMARIQLDIREAKEEDKGAMMAQYEQLYAILRQLRGGRTQAEIDPDCPYFAHLRIDEEHRQRHLYLGRATRLDHGLRIVDWRNAPISRIFYLYREGEEFAEEMGARVLEGYVGARRTVSIQRGDLVQVSAPQGIFQRDEEGGWERLEREAPQLAGGEGASFHIHLQAEGRLRRLGGGPESGTAVW